MMVQMDQWNSDQGAINSRIKASVAYMQEFYWSNHQQTCSLCSCGYIHQMSNKFDHRPGLACSLCSCGYIHHMSNKFDHRPGLACSLCSCGHIHHMSSTFDRQPASKYFPQGIKPHSIIVGTSISHHSPGAQACSCLGGKRGKRCAV